MHCQFCSTLMQDVPGPLRRIVKGGEEVGADFYSCTMTWTPTLQQFQLVIAKERSAARERHAVLFNCGWCWVIPSVPPLMAYSWCTKSWAQTWSFPPCLIFMSSLISYWMNPTLPKQMKWVTVFYRSTDIRNLTHPPPFGGPSAM